MIKKLILLVSPILFGITLCFAVIPKAGAVDVFNDICTNTNGNQVQNSTVCKSKNLNGKNPLFGPEGVITRAISIVSIIVGVVAIIMIIVGGLRLITSGSNPQDVTKARETIIYAIAGVMIAGIAQAIVQFFLKRIN